MEPPAARPALQPILTALLQVRGGSLCAAESGEHPHELLVGFRRAATLLDHLQQRDGEAHRSNIAESAPTRPWALTRSRAAWLPLHRGGLRLAGVVVGAQR